jgi:hypothetical protein
MIASMPSLLQSCIERLRAIHMPLTTIANGQANLGRGGGDPQLLQGIYPPASE